ARSRDRSPSRSTVSCLQGRESLDTWFLGCKAVHGRTATYTCPATGTRADTRGPRVKWGAELRLSDMNCGKPSYDLLQAARNFRCRFCLTIKVNWPDCAQFTVRLFLCA